MTATANKYGVNLQASFAYAVFNAVVPGMTPPERYTPPTGYAFDPWFKSLAPIRYGYKRLAEMGYKWNRTFVSSTQLERRLWGTNRGTLIDFSQITDWEAVDLEVRLCKAYGVKLVLCVEGAYAPGWGQGFYDNSIASYANWTTNYVFPLVAFLADRYKDDYDTVLIEPFNEGGGVVNTNIAKLSADVYDVVKANCHAAPNDIKVLTVGMMYDNGTFNNYKNQVGSNTDYRTKFDYLNFHKGAFYDEDTEGFDMSPLLGAVNDAISWLDSIGRTDCKIIGTEFTPIGGPTYGSHVNAHVDGMGYWLNSNPRVEAMLAWSACWTLTEPARAVWDYQPYNTAPWEWEGGIGYPVFFAGQSGHMEFFYTDTHPSDTDAVAVAMSKNLPGRISTEALVSVAHLKNGNLMIDAPADATANYRIDGGEWQIYSQPLPFVSGTVEYFATMGEATEPTQIFAAVALPPSLFFTSQPSVAAQVEGGGLLSYGTADTEAEDVTASAAGAASVQARATFREAVSAVAAAGVLADSVRSMAEAVLSSALVTTTAANTLHQVEAALAQISVFPTVQDILSFADQISAPFIFTAQPSISMQTGDGGILAYGTADGGADDVASQASVTAQVADLVSRLEALVSTIQAVPSVADMLARLETVTSEAEVRTSVTDLKITGVAESLSSAATAIAEVRDLQLMVDNVTIMARSGAALEEIAEYLESVSSAAAVSATVADVLRGSFVGRYLFTDLCAARLFADLAGPRFFTDLCSPRGRA